MTERSTDARPRLKAQWHVAYDGNERAFFISDQRTFYLDGSLYVALVPMLDGERSDAEIASALRDVASMSDVARGLQRLRYLGVIAEGRATGDLGELAYFDTFEVDPQEARRRLRDGLVAIASSPDIDISLLETFLDRSGVRSERIGDDSPFDEAAVVVGVFSDYLAPGLQALNARAVSSKVPLLCVKPLGLAPWVGPLVVPGSTACVACLGQRLRSSRQIDAYLRARDAESEPVRRSLVGLGTTVASALALAAGEVVTALAATTPSTLAGQLVTFDAESLAIEHHPVSRLPQCPVCGNPELASRSGEQIAIVSRPTISGSHRVATAEQTERRLSHHVDPITGAVSQLIPLDAGLGGLTYSYAAAHSFAVLGRRFDNLVKSMRGSLSGGKGRTEAAARTGALCEALERFVSVFRGDEHRVRSSYEGLSERALVPDDLAQFSEAQFAGRHDNANVSRFAYVPDRFDPSRPIDWTGAWSLSTNSRVLVPSAYCYYGHPDLADHEFCRSDSNGQAAGGCIEEAILQGFYELVERDAVALWWFNRLRRPALDLDRVSDPYLDSLREYYRSVGRDLWVLDLTADTDVATYAACSRRLDHPVEDIIVGFGAHLDPAAALERAIDECNQFLPGVNHRQPDGSTQYWSGADQEALEWWQHATLVSEPYLVPADVPLRALPTSAAFDDLADDVAVVFDRLERLGLELVVVDLTRPDVELSVAKVIVPSMRHFWRQLGPGRLYDVPVELGWLDAPLGEDELNPRTIFF